MDRPELGLHQLHAFAVLAEELHFGRAAQRLGIAQPPLSQQIRRLEQKVGYPLFGLDAARRTGSGMTGRIRIGFAASLALSILPGLLRAYRDRFPGVELDIREMTTAPQVAALSDHVLDVGLLRDPPTVEGLVFDEVLAERYVAVLPAAHPLAAQRIVSVAALSAEPFVLMPRAIGPSVHDRILEVCGRAGFEPRVTQRAVEWQTVVALVGASLGVSLAPASIGRIRLTGVVYRRIDPDTVRTTVALGRRREDHNPLVHHLIEAVRSLR